MTRLGPSNNLASGPDGAGTNTSAEQDAGGDKSGVARAPNAAEAGAGGGTGGADDGGDDMDNPTPPDTTPPDAGGDPASGGIAGPPGSGKTVEPPAGDGTDTPTPPETQPPTNPTPPGNPDTSGGDPASGGIAGPPGSGQTTDPTTGDTPAPTETTPEFTQGIETAAGRIAEQAQTLQNQVVSEWTGLEASDVAVTRQGDRLVAEVSQAAERQLVADALAGPGTTEKLGAVQRARAAARTGRFEASLPAPENKAEAVAEMQPQPGDKGVTRDSEVDMATDAVMNKARAAIEDMEAAEDARGRARAAAERRAETASFTATVPEIVPGIGGATLGTLTGQARNVEPDAGDGAGMWEAEDRAVSQDIDWSGGLFGPGDEVEGTLNSIEGRLWRGARRFGRLTAGGNINLGTDSDGPQGEQLSDLSKTDLQAAEGMAENRGSGRIDPGKAQRTAQGVATGIAGLPAMAAGLPGTVLEGVETGVSAADAVAEGETEQYLDAASDAAAGTVAASLSSAARNPYRTAGMAAGSLVGSAGAIGAASKVSPRLGSAVRYSVQPGEEALGVGGYKVTRAVGGEGAADKLFPDQEPLIFSEEAALRAGRRAADAASPGTLKRFAGATRGQAGLTGSLQDTESGTDTDTGDDLGVPDDDPFRVSDKRLFDPAREFGDADDPSRFIDDTRTGQPLYEQDIQEGIAGRGNPQTATGEYESFEENFNARIEAAQEPDADVATEGRQRRETAVGTAADSRVRDRGRVGVRQPSDVRSGAGVETRLGSRTDTRVDAGFEAAMESAVETDAGVETAVEAETTTETAMETETETETAREVESLGPPEDDDDRRGFEFPDVQATERRFTYEAATPEEVLDFGFDETQTQGGQ